MKIAWEISIILSFFNEIHFHYALQLVDPSSLAGKGGADLFPQQVPFQKDQNQPKVVSTDRCFELHCITSSPFSSQVWEKEIRK